MELARLFGLPAAHPVVRTAVLVAIAPATPAPARRDRPA